MRAIDADALKKQLDFGVTGTEEFDKGYDIGVQTAIEMIDNAPTVEERPTGEWEKSDFTYEIDAFALGEGVRLQVYTCSNPCCCMSVTRRSAYCPNCGAKMKNKESDDND